MATILCCRYCSYIPEGGRERYYTYKLAYFTYNGGAQDLTWNKEIGDLSRLTEIHYLKKKCPTHLYPRLHGHQLYSNYITLPHHTLK